MKKQAIIIGLILSLICWTIAAAEDSQPASAPLSAKPQSAPIPESAPATLEVTIDAIEGEVEVRHFREKDWVPAVKGMVLKEGARISTGFKAKAILLFSDNSAAVVNSLTQMTISRFSKDGNSVKTDLSLRIGSIRVKVKENQPVKTDMKISTPNATASVRGTEINEVKSSSHFGDTISIESGKVNFATKEGNINVQGGESTNQSLINPLENALLKIVAQISPIGLTKSEIQDLIISPNLINDITSNTANPIKDKISSQESSECFECQPCPECGHYPCVCVQIMY